MNFGFSDSSTDTREAGVLLGLKEEAWSSSYSLYWPHLCDPSDSTWSVLTSVTPCGQLKSSSCRPPNPASYLPRGQGPHCAYILPSTNHNLPLDIGLEGASPQGRSDFWERGLWWRGAGGLQRGQSLCHCRASDFLCLVALLPSH